MYKYVIINVAMVSIAVYLNYTQKRAILENLLHCTACTALHTVHVHADCTTMSGFDSGANKGKLDTMRHP